MFGKKRDVDRKSYGKYTMSEFAGIDFIRLAQVELAYLKEHGREFGWGETFHPTKYFYSLYFDDNLDKSKSEEERIKSLGCVVYYSAFESENKDWFKNNKEFIENTETSNRHYLTKMKKLPIAMDDDTFQIWFANSVRFISYDWQDKNPEFMNYWNQKLQDNNEAFVEACKIGDMKAVRKTVKMGNLQKVK